MEEPELARLDPPTDDRDGDAPRERYGSRRLAPVLLIRRARVQGEARAQRARVRDDDELEIASSL